MRKFIENIKQFMLANNIAGKVRLEVTAVTEDGQKMKAKANCGCEANWVNKHPEELTEYSKSILLDLVKNHDQAPEGLEELKKVLEEIFGESVASANLKPEAPEAPSETVNGQDVEEAGRIIGVQLNRLLEALDTDPSLAEKLGVVALVDHALGHIQYLYDELNELRKAEVKASEKVRAARKLLKGL